MFPQGDKLTVVCEVGGTSGIGEATARAFVRDTVSSRVYLVGRNEAQASKIIQELRQLNPDGQISFVKCDAANLKSVDEVCKTIQQKENHINLLFMTVGIFTTKGRDGERLQTPLGRVNGHSLTLW